ncbi:hypothetical protein JZX87_23010 [Agrobacterium sp. Ap1]|uniref:hypothetical protein n=1 Tax=Agrobacterium sp. Ap1 TaxID=2815337 RepID=UPI000FBFF6BD|nr:hypothetical protein [Agrobacterium sp. Ap1]MBO0144030.1 hypothetical protein [Agrobacterium sp. Ap1]
MFAQFHLYAIIALIIAVVVLGSGWYISHRVSSAEINNLSQRNVVLTSAVEQNERTIATLIADAQVLAALNQKLTSRIGAARMEHVEAWHTIDALDLEFDTGDAAVLEARANDTFAASIDALRMRQENSLIATGT